MQAPGNVRGDQSVLSQGGGCEMSEAPDQKRKETFVCFSRKAELSKPADSLFVAVALRQTKP